MERGSPYCGYVEVDGPMIALNYVEDQAHVDHLVGTVRRAADGSYDGRGPKGSEWVLGGHRRGRHLRKLDRSLSSLLGGPQ